MGISATVLGFLGWVPDLELPKCSPSAIVSVSYALKDLTTLTPMTESVTLASAELYKKFGGRSLVFFTTSDFLEFNGKKDSEIEAGIRTSMLVGEGVSLENIFPVFGTHNTRSESENIRKILMQNIGGSGEIILCTQYLHSRRALEVFRRAFPNFKVYNCPVVCDQYVNNLLPLLRRWSGRAELFWSFYMVITWIMSKLRII